MSKLLIKYFLKDELVYTYVYPHLLDIVGEFNVIGELRGYLIDMNLDNIETRGNKIITITVNTLDEQKLGLLRFCNWNLKEACDLYLAFFEKIENKNGNL